MCLSYRGSKHGRRHRREAGEAPGHSRHGSCRGDGGSHRVDEAWKAALAASDKDSADKAKIIRVQGIIIVVLVLTIIGLAGYKVAGNLLGVGNVEIGGDASETP